MVGSSASRIVRILLCTCVPERGLAGEAYNIGATNERTNLEAFHRTCELGWKPRETFKSGLLKTIRSYLESQEWMANVTSGAYRDWIALNYGAAR